MPDIGWGDFATALTGGFSGYIQDRERNREWQYRQSLMELQKTRDQRAAVRDQRAFQAQQFSQDMQKINALISFGGLPQELRGPIGQAPSTQRALPGAAGMADVETPGQRRLRIAGLVQTGADLQDMKDPQDRAMFQTLSGIKNSDPKTFNMIAAGLPNLSSAFATPRQQQLTPVQELQQIAFFDKDPQKRAAAFETLKNYERSRAYGTSTGALLDALGPDNPSPGGPGAPAPTLRDTYATFKTAVTRAERGDAEAYAQTQQLINLLDQQSRGHPHREQIMGNALRAREALKTGRNPELGDLPQEPPPGELHISPFQPGTGAGLPHPPPGMAETQAVLDAMNPSPSSQWRGVLYPQRQLPSERGQPGTWR